MDRLHSWAVSFLQSCLLLDDNLKVVVACLRSRTARVSCDVSAFDVAPPTPVFVERFSHSESRSAHGLLNSSPNGDVDTGTL